jgi:hypothetical protein
MRAAQRSDRLGDRERVCERKRMRDSGRESESEGEIDRERERERGEQSNTALFIELHCHRAAGPFAESAAGVPPPAGVTADPPSSLGPGPGAAAAMAAKKARRAPS